MKSRLGLQLDVVEVDKPFMVVVASVKETVPSAPLHISYFPTFAYESPIYILLTLETVYRRFCQGGSK